MRSIFSKITLATLCLALAFFISCSDMPDINDVEATSSSSGKGASNPSSSSTKPGSSSSAVADPLSSSSVAGTSPSSNSTPSSSSVGLSSSSTGNGGSSSGTGNGGSSSSAGNGSSSSSAGNGGSSSSAGNGGSSSSTVTNSGSSIATGPIWNGTADISWYKADRDKFQISTAEQLAGLAELVNGGTNFSGKTITLTADIMLNDTTGWKRWDYDEPTNAWIPIGKDKTNSFKGTFDGDGRIVSGVYYYNANGSNIGLFGYINGGVIKKLGVVASYIYALSNVGCLLGEAYKGSNISNSYSKCIIETKSGSRVGGLVGSSVQTTISDCYSTSTVQGNSGVGGLIGCACGDFNDFGYIQDASNISNSYSTGEVSGMKVAETGGLAGVHQTGAGSNGNGKVTNSYYDKDTSKQSDTNKGVPKTTEEMQNADFAATLETAFKYNPGGYPKLTWEK